VGSPRARSSRGRIWNMDMDGCRRVTSENWLTGTSEKGRAAAGARLLLSIG